MSVLCQCCNCGELHDEDDLEPIEDLSMRVAPGEVMPYGECPDCGCLCHKAPDKPFYFVSMDMRHCDTYYVVEAPDSDTAWEKFGRADRKQLGERVGKLADYDGALEEIEEGAVPEEFRNAKV